MHLQKDCRAYVKLLLYCITGWRRIWDMDKRDWKTSWKEEAEEKQQEPAAAKEQQQDHDERYDTVAKIKLVYEGKRGKEFRVTGNLNTSITKMIRANITPHIEMATKAIYWFKSEFLGALVRSCIPARY